VLKLRPEGLTVTEIAPGVDLERDVLRQVDIPLQVAEDLRLMDERLFRPEPMGLKLRRAGEKSSRRAAKEIV
jgi:acyl CoA:acetate/3-ketoacid CoA transferase